MNTITQVLAALNEWLDTAGNDDSGDEVVEAVQRESDDNFKLSEFYRIELEKAILRERT